MTTTVEPVPRPADAHAPGMVTMDVEGRIRIPRPAAITAAILRICMGLIYLWAFIAQGSPSNNPVFDTTHFLLGFTIFLLMWLHASNYWGIGRWWRAHTPALLH
jgi:hypothetical protein